MMTIRAARRGYDAPAGGYASPPRRTWYDTPPNACVYCEAAPGFPCIVTEGHLGADESSYGTPLPFEHAIRWSMRQGAVA